MQSKLQQAVFDAVTEDDIQAIVAKQVEKAKEGDDKAMQYVMKYVVGFGSTTKLEQTNVLVATTEQAARIANNHRAKD
jgi:hypothetical protein